MKTERIVLSFIAVVIGIIVAGVGFYFYQTTKANSDAKTKTIAITNPTAVSPSPEPSHFLTIDIPSDEEVVTSKTLRISGKTTPGTIVVISSQSDDLVITPASTGAFSTTTTLSDGVNHIDIRAIAPSGEESKVSRTVTYTKETF